MTGAVITVFLWTYLLGGIACAVAMVAILKKATDPDAPAGLQEATRGSVGDLERLTSQVPGRIWGLLVLIVLLWPAMVVSAVKKLRLARHAKRAANSAVELLNVQAGDPRYEELIGQIRTDPVLCDQMWADAEHTVEELPDKVWSFAIVREGDRWVPAAWAAARPVDGVLLCSDNYERRGYRNRGLYRQAYAHRHRTVVVPSGLPAQTFIFAQPRSLHEADGWKPTGLTGTSHEAGNPHDWWELRRKAS